MKIKLLITTLLFLIAALIFYSCDTTEPGGDPPKPPGYQEDIDWPSLADSPWPMYRADPQNTGRSKYVGPSIGEIFKQIPAYNMQNTPVLGKNHQLYFSTSALCTLFAYTNYESVNWSKKIGYDTHTTPLIDTNNNIYITSDGKLNKFDQDGNLLWSITLGNGELSASLTIDKNGNIYVIENDKTLYSVNENGTLNWSFHEEDLFIHTYHAPAFSPDGNTIYLQGESVSLIAFDINSKTIKWKFGNSALPAGPVVDSQGNIYIIPSDLNKKELTLYSISNNGTIRWQFTYFSKYASTSEEPAIDKEGNIYLGFKDSLYAVDYEGNLKWKRLVDLNISRSSIVVDNNGSIYFTVHGDDWSNRVMGYDSNGNFLWSVKIKDQYVLYPPLLTSDNKLVVPSIRSSFLYILR